MRVAGFFVGRRRMAYIAPGTEIRLLTGVPLTSDYENTLYFGDITAQSSYFLGRTSLSTSANSFQRVEKGTLRVEAEYGTVYCCNYMMFRNLNHVGKWYYAFVNEVRYINEETVEVDYELDVLQTWLFQLQFEQCFIERQHTVSDDLYENLVPENLDLGDSYVCPSYTTFDMNSQRIALLTTCYENGDQITGGESYGNLYSGLHLIKGTPTTDTSGVDSLIGSLVDSGDENSIVAAYQFPSFVGDSYYNTEQKSITRASYFGATHSVDGIFGSYTPKNNKLWSYPYCYIEVSNNSGQSAQYRWEDWGQGHIDENGNAYASFTIEACIVPNAVALCYPTQYKGTLYAYDYGLTYNNFPQVAWAGDAFKAWYAQNQNSANMGIFNTALNNAITGTMLGANFGPWGAVAGGVIGATAGAYLGTASLMAKKGDLEQTPPQVHGQTGTGSLNAAAGRSEFSFYQRTIKPEFAKMIDDFFNLYGYAIHEVATPNIDARPHWTYVKTVGCDVQGSIPQKDKTKICEIFDRGIRWWRSASEVGNYSLDNSPAVS